MSSHYFEKLSRSLSNEAVHHPILLIDKARLDHNIEQVKKVTECGLNFRIVAKSLPCLALLNYMAEKTSTNRFMSFHLPFVKYLAAKRPDADILLGKPMNVSAVSSFYQWHQKQTTDFNPDKQLQWLVDSVERLNQYEQYAKSTQQVLKINLELDIGLHRGGFSDTPEGRERFVESLRTISACEYLELGGVMGYEAHVTKIPSFLGGPKKAFAKAMESYERFTALIKSTLGEASLENLCLNAGGSSTYPLYDNNSPCNEISTASALVKPTDFDVYTLDQHQEAAFIAAPVLKMVRNPEIPMAKGLSDLMRRIGLIKRDACFIYGGNWLATPCYPKGAKRSGILGHSSNQEMYELPSQHSLNMDDFMYFRPTQSEAVFLQFGQIAVYEDGAISQWWPVFDYSQSDD